jgi:hypothetical protein
MWFLACGGHKGAKVHIAALDQHQPLDWDVKIPVGRLSGHIG